jgi:hypothetical protein
MGSFFTFCDEIAFFVGIGGSWQLDSLCHGVVGLHLFLTVQRKLPRAAEVDGLTVVGSITTETEQ